MFSTSSTCIRLFLNMQLSLSAYKFLPQNEKAATFFSHTKSFSPDTHQSMKTLDSDLKVNQYIYIYIYLDAVNVIECI